MPPTVPIDKGLVILFSEGLQASDIETEVLDSYVAKGCSTLLVCEGSSSDLGKELLRVPCFESKAGKIAVYYGERVPEVLESAMVEVCEGGLEEAKEDKTHKLSVCLAKKTDSEALNRYLRYHLENPDRPHTPWIMLVIPCPDGETYHTRRSVLESLAIDDQMKEKLNSGKKVAAVSVSMCPDTCRVDAVQNFSWPAFVEAAGGVALKPGDAVFELCYRVGLSPKFGD